MAEKKRASKSPKVKYPIHKKGKHCGYEEYADGSIKVALMYADPLADAGKEADAVEALLKAITEQCHRLLIPITAAQNRFWENVTEDYGLELDRFDYTYNRQTQIITRKDRVVPEKDNR